MLIILLYAILYMAGLAAGTYLPATTITLCGTQGILLGSHTVTQPTTPGQSTLTVHVSLYSYHASCRSNLYTTTTTSCNTVASYSTVTGTASTGTTTRTRTNTVYLPSNTYRCLAATTVMVNTCSGTGSSSTRIVTPSPTSAATATITYKFGTSHSSCALGAVTEYSCVSSSTGATTTISSFGQTTTVQIGIGTGTSGRCSPCLLYTSRCV